MNEHESMTRMVERTGLDVTHLNMAVVEAAKAWRACTDVAEQDIAAQRLGDAVDRLPIDLVPVEPLASVTLLTNRREEYARREDILRERHERAVDRRAAELVGEPDPWPHTNPCPEQCEGCGCCIHSTLGCSARDLPDGSLCGGVGCGCEGRS